MSRERAVSIHIEEQKPDNAAPETTAQEPVSPELNLRRTILRDVLDLPHIAVTSPVLLPRAISLSSAGGNNNAFFEPAPAAQPDTTPAAAHATPGSGPG